MESAAVVAGELVAGGVVSLDVARARKHPLYPLLTPRRGRILITRPHRKLSQQLSTTTSGLAKPKQSWRDAREYGLVCTVLKVGPGCAPELRPDVQVLVPMFGGVCVYDLTEGGETDLWIVGDGEVMCVLERSDAG